MARIIGMDLGSWAVKIAVLEGGFGRYEVEEYLAATIMTEDGTPATLSDKTRTLEGLLAGLTPSDRAQFGAAFPTEKSSVRMIDLPFTDKNQINQTLSFEVEDRVPFDLEDMVLSHRIVSIDDAGSHVLTAVTPRDAIGPVLTALEAADADPKTLVIDGDILGSLAATGVPAIVDIGHERTVITVCREGNVIGTRAILFGGKQLTQALMDAHGISWAEAEKRKHAASLAASPAMVEWDESEVTESGPPPVRDGSGPSDSAILTEALQPMLAHLRATLIHFEDSLQADIEMLWIAGGSAALTGLDKALEGDLGVPVRTLRISPEAHLAGQPERFALSHALAERAAGIGGNNAMELRQGDFKYRGDLANLRTIALYSCFAAAAAVLLGIGFFAKSVMDLNKEIAALDAQLSETVGTIVADGEEAPTFDDPDDALTVLQIKTLETTSRIDLLGSIVSDTPPTLNTLSQISSSLPDPSSARIDVRELTISNANINIQAETDGYDAASTIEASLQEHVRFKGARKGDEKKYREAIRFSVTIPLEEESTTTEEG